MVWDKSNNDMTPALNYVRSIIEEIRWLDWLKQEVEIDG